MLIMKCPILILLVGFLILTSCNDFYFKNPQPLHGKELKAIPDELVGTYMEKDADTLKHVNEDPLIITRNSYNLKTSEPSVQGMKLSGSLENNKVVLKKLDDFYVLSQKIPNPINSSRDSVWEVYVLEYRHNHLTLYNLASDGKEPKIDSIKQITPVKEQKEGNDKYYLLNPSNKQFKKLLINNLYSKIGEFNKVK